MKTRRSAIKCAAAAVIELLEQRRLLSAAPQLSVTTSAVNNAVAFNTIATGYSGAAASPIETATITDSGTAPLTFASGAFSIVNAPSQTAAASDFAITNSSSLPSSLSPGQSFTIDLQYTATAVGLQYALLQIQSNDPVNPTYNVSLNGIGTPGKFGTLEPSLVQVLQAQNIPTIVGAGHDDANVNTQAYPIDPDSSSQEVPMQRLVVATAGAPVTITPIASFSAATAAVSRIGYYTPGNPGALTELFYIGEADDQTVDPTALGATSFNPGSAPFGLYGTFPGTTIPSGELDTHYSEDALNTGSTDGTRKIRFFPMESENGTVVPNTFVFAIEDYDSSAYNSFINFVGIISNVQAAPNATMGSVPSATTANNPPVMGVDLNQTSPGSTTLVFNDIKIPNPIVPDVVHNTQAITINNTGDNPLTIDSLTLSDTTNWALVDPPAPGTQIAADSSLNVTIKFIATTNPSHTNNQTNDISTTNDIPSVDAGGVWTGTLTITSNDPVNPTQKINLAGYWQDASEHENEPGVDTLTNLLFQYDISDTGAASKDGTEFPNNGNTPVIYGSEVDPSTDQGLLVAADPSQPVSEIELAAFHQQYLAFEATVGSNTEALESASESGTTVTITCEQADGFATGNSVTIGFGNGSSGAPPGYLGTFTITSTPTANTFTYTAASSGLATYDTQPTQAQAGWYPAGGSTEWLSKDQPNNGQSLYPLLDPDSYSTVQTSFSPTGAFGLNLDGMYSQDSKNSEDLQYDSSEHGLRFFPVTEANGDIVPNTWIVAMDYRDYLNPNSDYQDLFMLLTNATFEAMPPTPIDLQATQGITGVNLQWAPMTGAVSYNVLASVNGGAFAQLNSSPITTTGFVDTTSPSGAAVTYEVMSVNSSSVSSLPASASVNIASTTAPPAAPAILQADGSSGTQVSLSWTAPAGATGYNLQREGPGQSSFTTIASDLTSTSYVDTNVTGGSTYQYQVQATNTAGASPYSSTISVTVSMMQTAPPVPTIQMADGSSGTQVVLTWGASSGATTYNIQREGPGESSFSLVASGVTSTSYTDTNVNSDATYMYEVQAQNSTGLSTFSAPVSVTVAQGPPAAPTDLQYTTATDSVALTWDASAGATTYEVQSQGPGQSSFATIASGLTSPAYTDTGVTAGDTYSYQVIAVDAAGSSPPSSPVSATLPPAPATLSVAIGTGVHSFVKFTTASGAVVTIKLNGPGTATVNFTANSISQSASGKGVAVTGTNVAIAGITTVGTTGASSLMVTTKGGNNAVNIGGITVNTALNSINAPTASLIGTLSVTGSINRITLGSAVAATITIGDNLGSFRATSVTGASLGVVGVIGSIVAGSWASNQAVTAAAINSVNLGGNAQIDVTAGTLHSLRVQGELDDSALALSAPGAEDLANLSAFAIDDTILDTIGSIGTIAASMLDNSQIYAGAGASGPVAFPPVSTAFAETATIANINLKTVKGAFSDTDSSIAANQIDHLSLGNVQFANGGIPFGVQAVSIKLLSAANPSVKPFTFHNLTSQTIVSTDFSAKKINPEDFDITFLSQSSGS